MFFSKGFRNSWYSTALILSHTLRVWGGKPMGFLGLENYWVLGLIGSSMITHKTGDLVRIGAECGVCGTPTAQGPVGRMMTTAGGAVVECLQYSDASANTLTNTMEGIFQEPSISGRCLNDVDRLGVMMIEG